MPGDFAATTPRGYVALVTATKTILGSSIGSAVSLAALWWMLNGIYRVNGVGWLARMGWPFDSVVLCAVVGAVGGAVLGWIRFRRQGRHRVDLAVLSEKLDLQFNSEPEEFQPPPMPLFEKLESIDNRMSGIHEGVSVEVFDLATVVKSDEGSKTYRQTVVLLPAPGLPKFQLNAKTLGYRFLDWIGARGITFDPAAGPTEEDRTAIAQFGRNYNLSAGDTTDLAAGTPEIFTEQDQLVRTRFTLEVLKALAKRPGWSIQSDCEHLALWMGREVRPANERPRLLASALALRTALLQSSVGAVVVPPLPGADRSRQSARFQGALLGGAIGLFVSFFFAFIAFAAVMSGKPAGDPGFPFEILLVPLTLAIGTCIGIFLGSRLPITKPLLRKPKDPKHEKRVGCAILFGLFGGFIFGGVAGAALGMVLQLGFDDFVPRMVLFFGGSGVGAIAGPILCGMAANKLLRRKETRTSEPPSEV